MTTSDEQVARLVELLDGRSVATAESCTGGMLAQLIAKAEGSSDWYRGGVVAYQRQTKFRVLGVTPGPVVSEPAAREMALGAARLLDATTVAAITGAAGPDPQDGATPGTVVIATLVDGSVCANTHDFDGTPDEVCEQARDAAVAALIAALRKGVTERGRSTGV